MSKISKRVLHQELENYIFDLFIKTISDLKNESEVKNFVEDLLSPSERIMLIKRLAIAILLSKDYTYDAIDETLKVSRPTITRVSISLKYGKSGYQQVTQKILQRQKKEKLLDTIDELLLKLTPPKAYGSIGYKKKQILGKELSQRKRKRNLL